ncbi:MAG TPA: serine hydrolase domain-containing protein [Gemmatimonadales bacterium]
MGPAILIGWTAGRAAAQDPTAVMDSLFAGMRRTDAPGCVAGVDLNGARVVRGYGMANLEYAVPLSPESISETGSVAKQFTAAAIGLLALRGRLSLDDDIRKYLPEVPSFDGRTITIRHLLHHTSGLRDQWGLLSIEGHPPGREVHTFGRILDLVSRQRMLNFSPGDEYLYSNTGYALSAVLVTRVAGKPFAQFTAEELFRPLGMTHTQWRDDYRRIVPNRATAYDRQQNAWVQDMPFTMVHGNGGLLTTVGDLLIWNAALTAGTIPGGAEVVRMLETPGRLNDGSAIRYALGLNVDRYKGVREVSHGGSTAGYRTFLARWPERGLSVAILCNAGTANAGGSAHRIADRLLALPAEQQAPAAAEPVAAEELERLAGLYRDSTTDQVITIAVRDGRLTVAASGPSAPLTHLGEMRFWSGVAGEYRFERLGEHWRVVQFAEGWRRYDPFQRIDAALVRADDYRGRYRSPELDVVVTVEGDSGVSIRPPLAEPVRLTPIYRDGFAAPGRTIRFMRDAGGRVTGFRIFAGRVRDLRFERVE